MNKVKVFSLVLGFREREFKVRKILLAALGCLQKKNVIVYVYIVDSKKMRFINKYFRGKDKVTDVLSFKEPKNFPHPESPLICAGEIYLNPTYIKRKIWESRSESDIIWRQLLIHSLLHLFNYNHSKKSDRIEMKNKEDFLISRVLL